MNSKQTIGVYVIGTNSYFPMLIRFVKRFIYFYKGENKIKFLLFTDRDPLLYLPESTDYIWFETNHSSWLDGTNSKYKNIIVNESKIDVDYLFYFDADTNIKQSFTDDIMIHDIVSLEHYGNSTYMVTEGRPFDNNKLSSCYLDRSDPKYTYYHGSFVGGSYNYIKTFFKYLVYLQEKNKAINHEPPWNDESYLNYALNKVFLPTKIIKFKDFPLITSDKGGIEDTRNTSKSTRVEEVLNLFKEKRDDLLLEIN